MPAGRRILGLGTRGSAGSAPVIWRICSVSVSGRGSGGESAVRSFRAGPSGSSAGASGGKKDATTVAPGYYKGMATFTVAKGGLMYEASIGGQKFPFQPIGDEER